MGRFIVNQVALDQFFHVQTNNKYNPFITCFPTSVAMAIDYILTLIGKTPKDIGIDESQIEDYLTKIAKTPSVTKWMINTLGSWTNNYLQKSWLVGRVEEKLFDDLMNKIGYDSMFCDHMSYETLCKTLQETNLPQVVCGNFSSSMKQYGHTVGGHINCCIGFDDTNREIIVHDPYGYALSPGYYDPKNPNKGFKVTYKWDQFFVKNKDNSGWCLQIRKA